MLLTRFKSSGKHVLYYHVAHTQSHAWWECWVSADNHTTASLYYFSYKNAIAFKVMVYILKILMP